MNFLISLSLLLIVIVDFSVDSKKTSPTLQDAGQKKSKNVPRVASKSLKHQLADDYVRTNDMYSGIEQEAEAKAERIMDTIPGGDDYDLPNAGDDPVDEYYNGQSEDEHMTNIIVVQDDGQDDTHLTEVIVLDGEQIPLDVDTGGNGINIIEVESDAEWNDVKGNYNDGQASGEIVIIVSDDQNSTPIDLQLTTITPTENLEETTENVVDYDTTTVNQNPTNTDYDDTTPETRVDPNPNENYDDDHDRPTATTTRTTTTTIIPVTSATTTTTITNSSNCHCTIIVNNYFYNNYDPAFMDPNVMGPSISYDNYIPPSVPPSNWHNNKVPSSNRRKYDNISPSMPRSNWKNNNNYISRSIPNSNWKHNNNQLSRSIPHSTNWRNIDNDTPNHNLKKSRNNNNNVRRGGGRQGRTTRRLKKKIGNKKRMGANGKGSQRRLKTKFASRNLGRASGIGTLNVYKIQRRKGKRSIIKKMRKQVYRQVNPRTLKHQKRSNTLTWRVVPKWKAQKLKKINPAFQVGQIEARRIRSPIKTAVARKKAVRRGRIDNNVKRSSHHRPPPNALKFNNRVMQMNKKIGNQFGLEELKLGLKNKLRKK